MPENIHNSLVISLQEIHIRAYYIITTYYAGIKGMYVYVLNILAPAHHSKEEIVGHCRKIYCPLLYLKPPGFVITKLNTPPGSTETYKVEKDTCKNIFCMLVSLFQFAFYRIIY